MMYSNSEFKENRHTIRSKSCLKTDNVRTVTCSRKLLRHPCAKLWGMFLDSVNMLP